MRILFTNYANYIRIMRIKYPFNPRAILSVVDSVRENSY
jgi:hypothetical protein